MQSGDICYGAGDYAAAETCLVRAREAAVPLEPLAVGKSLPDEEKWKIVEMLFETYMKSTELAWRQNQQVTYHDQMNPSVLFASPH